MFQLGERVFYVLSPGYRRPVMKWLPATILNITPRRVVIRVDGSIYRRNVLTDSLTRTEGEVPPGMAAPPKKPKKDPPDPPKAEPPPKPKPGQVYRETTGRPPS